jgi:hypothetical protein
LSVTFVLIRFICLNFGIILFILDIVQCPFWYYLFCTIHMYLSQFRYYYFCLLDIVHYPFISAYSDLSAAKIWLFLIPLFNISWSKFRMRHHLSHPKGQSVNGFIPTEFSSVRYTRIQDAILGIKEFKSLCYMAKCDIEMAYRNCLSVQQIIICSALNGGTSIIMINVWQWVVPLLVKYSSVSALRYSGLVRDTCQKGLSFISLTIYL